MSVQADDEILQDFLVEAGEILEKLSEQLVDLEQNPDDSGLLNAIFRGFHTVKGGAGFLQLEALVECCHAAENVFDLLRNGKRRVTPELMDVVLQALDTVNEMFDQVKQLQEPAPASPDLIAALARLGEPEGAPAAPAAPAAPTVAAPVDAAPAVSEPAAGGDITDAEFERLLNALDSVDAAPVEADDGVAPASAGDDNSEDEFEALLDELHGKGRFSPDTAQGASTPAQPATSSNPATASTAASSGDITDDEFEALLDELHGKGKFSPAPVEPAPADTMAETPGADSVPAATAQTGTSASDLISDDEFEALLDQLHGSGKG